MDSEKIRQKLKKLWFKFLLANIQRKRRKSLRLENKIIELELKLVRAQHDLKYFVRNHIDAKD